MPFKSFTDYLLLEKNYSALTVNAYQNDLKAFSEFITKEYQTESINQINYSQIRTWIVFFIETEISIQSIHRNISALNTYYKFLLKIKEIEVSPLIKHKALKTSKKIQIPFSETEVTTVLDELNFEKDFEGIRNKLIIELFYSTGIRRIELIELKLTSFNLENKTLKVLGKRNKERIIPLLSSVVKLLHIYMEERNSLEIIIDKECLFLSQLSFVLLSRRQKICPTREKPMCIDDMSCTRAF